MRTKFKNLALAGPSDHSLTYYAINDHWTMFKLLIIARAVEWAFRMDRATNADQNADS